MYIRNLRKPSPNKNIFKFSSFKNRSVILCESTLEFDACFHLEFSSDVKSYESQPVGIEYKLEGKVCRYTPDFRVVKFSGEIEDLEVKPTKYVVRESFRREFEAKRSAYRSQGKKLLLVTENQIRGSALLNNLKLLHRYASTSISELHLLAVSFVKAEKSLCIKQLAKMLNIVVGECIAACALIIATGLVKADIETMLLSENTILTEA